MRFPLIAVVLTLLVGNGPSVDDGQPSVLTQSRGRALRFVTLLGRDTIAVEEALWAGDSLRGVILVREPAVMRFEYLLRAAPSGGFASVQATQSVMSPDGWRVQNTATLTAFGDSVLMQIGPGGADRRVRAPAPLLSLPSSGALLWLAAERFDASAADSVSIPWIAPLGGIGGRFIARRTQGRSLEYRLSAGFAQMRRGDDGAIASVDARGTSLKIEMMPAQPGVLVETQERWSRMRGGLLSPRDTVRARVGDAEVLIDYGRPSVRGRDVFANGVLGDSVWRTGANAATQLQITRPIQFANGTLEPGTYSLFTRISGERADLIVNGRSGIWGTQYDAAANLLSVPMARRRAEFMEQFRIAVDSVQPAIVLRWADQEFRVPFAVLR